MASTKNTYRSQSLIFIAVILGIVAVVNYLGTQKFARLDFTQNHAYSISPATKRIVRNLDDIVNINVYFSKNLPSQMKRTETDVRDILSEYSAFAGKHLKITWIDPSVSDEEKGKVRALGIPEIQMQSYEKDKAQVVNGYVGIAILYADKKEVIPVVQNLGNFEYDLTQAIMKVVRTSVPKVGVLKTDTFGYVPPEVMQQMKMNNIKDKTEEQYKPVFDQLRRNYDVKTVDLSSFEPIDTSIKTLIIPGGEEAFFTDRRIFEIDQFFMRGGNLIVCPDAVKISFEQGVNAVAQNPKIIALLENYGARLEKSLVLDASCGQVQVPQNFGGFRMNVAVPYPYFVRVLPQYTNQNIPAVASVNELLIPWASPITLLVDSIPMSGKVKNSASNGDKVMGTVLVKSSEKSWTVSGYFDLNPQQKWAPPENKVSQSNLIVYLSGKFNSMYADKPIPLTKDTTAADSATKSSVLSQVDKDVTRTVIRKSVRKGNLIIAGDSDFLSAQNATAGSIAFILNAVDWLTQDDNLIGIRTRTLDDRPLQKDALKEGSAVPSIVRGVNIVLMPIIVILIGLALFLSRREKAGVGSLATAPQSKSQEKKA